MLLIWDQLKVDVVVLDFQQQLIHCKVTYKITHIVVMVTFVYGNQSIVARRPLWASLQRLSTGMDSPWLLLGDLNSMLSADEKQGGLPLTNYHIADFLKFTTQAADVSEL